MATGYKKLTRKARHLIRGLKREKHGSVQRTMAHELKAEVTRTHRGKGRTGIVNHGGPGAYQPMSGRARGILGRLGKSKVWSAQRQLVNELMHELQRMTNRAERKRKAAERRRRRAAAAGNRAGQAVRATGLGIKRADRATQAGVARSEPHVRRTAGKARERLAQARANRKARKRPSGRPQRLRPARTAPAAAGPVRGSNGRFVRATPAPLTARPKVRAGR